MPQHFLNWTFIMFDVRVCPSLYRNMYKLRMFSLFINTVYKWLLMLPMVSTPFYGWIKYLMDELFLLALINKLLKFLHQTQSFMKQLDDPQAQPKSQSSPNFCAELCKIQTCILVFSDLHSVIKFKNHLRKVLGPWTFTHCKTRNLLYSLFPPKLKIFIFN